MEDMTQLHVVTEEHTRRVLGVTPEEFEKVRHVNPSDLHDPFHLKGVRDTANYLRKMKQEQEKDPSKLLIVVPDYDTDGITSAAILTASLSRFGIEHRMYAPHSKFGYGLSSKAIDEIKEMYESDDYKISMILTADNGISSVSAVEYAKKLNISVLVTDHHLPPKEVPDALAIVNPNQEGDMYPFKGNAGATVAWKTMMTYAEMHDKEALEDIGRLIVFAGIANIADFMPILDENRYMAKTAVDYINHIRDIDIGDNHYSAIMNTPFPQYNAVFHGLYDLVTLLQKSKDDAREAKGKKPIPLPYNEEIVSWYLSPMLNAPRRVRNTSIEGMVSLLSTDHELRRLAVETVIHLNEEKSRMRDRVVRALDDNYDPRGHVLCANTKSGINGLIAGKISRTTGAPAIVFSYENEEDETVIYDEPPKQAHYLGASARSNDFYPLNRIIERINDKQPNMVSGGGHAAAAGMSIKASDYHKFIDMFQEAASEVYDDVADAVMDTETITNHITIMVVSPNHVIARYDVEDSTTGDILKEEMALNTETFASDVMKTIEFQDSLRPFGHKFEGETTFTLQFDESIKNMNWKPDFWKTFKFNLFGAEVLTFDEKWANWVKQQLQDKEPVEAHVKLSLNTFRGVTKPQFILSGN